MLTDGELLLGLSRHLAAYAASPDKAALEQLEFAGWTFEMAWRLRGSGVSTIDRTNAIAQDARIGRRRLHLEVLPAMETLGWVQLQRDGEQSISEVRELLPPPAELADLGSSALAIALPTPEELAALGLIRATTRQPLEVATALDAVAEHGEEAAEDALRHLSNLKLVRRVTADDGREVVFNPNIWVDDRAATAAALRAEDARISAEVGALIEEVSSQPGIPEVLVTSTEQRWVDFAVSQGLVQRSVVQTDGKERGFLFTPHLARDAFGQSANDASGHVRQLVGSMIYATTFASPRLWSPTAFVNALIRDGEAGDASPIGRDYPMLEKAGIVEVVPGSRLDRYRFVLRQPDVAEDALGILRERAGSSDIPNNYAALSRQRSYIHVEQERAQLAHDLPPDDVEQRRLVSALRDSIRSGRRGR